MPNKLTAPQQRVINALIENEGSYLHKSAASFVSKVFNNDRVILASYGSSVSDLINKKLLVEFEKDKYKLNPDFKQVIKN
jgi:outer membrane protein OmpA-like peptidoglycan-associated protein